MPTIDVTIVRRDSPPPWPDLETADVIHVPDGNWRVAALEAGAKSGWPSIALRIELPGGETLVAETTLAVWIAATAAMRGAFPEAFAGGPFAAE